MTWLIAELDKKPELQKHLYQKGFLITNCDIDNMDRYPFYGNWRKTSVFGFNFVVHNELEFFLSESQNGFLFLIGHCYNPIDLEYDENSILKKMASLEGADFWSYEAKLTGIYVMGKLTDSGKLIHWSDCAGMRISYYGNIGEQYIVTSHVNLAAAIWQVTEDKYIAELKNSKYFHLFGNVLPSDCSIYSELKRTVPNHWYSSNGDCKRFFPTVPLKECADEKEYQDVLEESATILRNSLKLCAQKWNGKRVSISVTGGKDSGETLASAFDVYDKFDYFSYISKPEEQVDAEAAQAICLALKLPHRIIEIPLDNTAVNYFDIMNELVYVNGGSIGYIRPNEVRKRCVLTDEGLIDVEVKSWVNEIVRAYWYKKYAKTKFPKKPTGKYLATLYKVFLGNRRLFNKTAHIFEGYIEKYMNTDDIELVGDWTTLWSWEFGFSAGEGQSLFAEHMLSYDITIPFNNRYLIALMLKPKLRDRIADRLQKDIIKRNNQVQSNLHIDVVNAAHTRKRALLERMYLYINTHLPF